MTISAGIQRTPKRGLLRRLLRFFFHHFYHGFAWTYDFVAAAVSVGRWNEWVAAAVPYVEGNRILEIGPGPGHLQHLLRQSIGAIIVGLDESPQMLQLAAERLLKAGYRDARLARGLAQALPFPSRCFDTVVSTFPADYIFEPQTAQEIRRVLSNRGRFVMLPAAWIVGKKAVDRAAAWLFRATDQVPGYPAQALTAQIGVQLEEAGFIPEIQTVEVRSSEVLVIIAEVRTTEEGRER